MLYDSHTFKGQIVVDSVLQPGKSTISVNADIESCDRYQIPHAEYTECKSLSYEIRNQIIQNIFYFMFIYLKLAKLKQMP